jgi:hypothetical protein
MAKRTPGNRRATDESANATVELHDGKQLNEWGEFCEVDVPHKIGMAGRFGANPLLGERETTATYRLEPSPNGTLCRKLGEGLGLAGRLPEQQVGTHTASRSNSPGQRDRIEP